MKEKSQLKPTTLKTYRSDLKRWSLLAKDRSQTRQLREWAMKQVIKLEAQLGITAGEVGSPGRPTGGVR